MDQTLGNRIMTNRKQLGLTQDQLAEKLGITAQAVSKWENDQSCPDITTLPKLAEIFGCSVDQLLGVEQHEEPAVHAGEVVTDTKEPDDSGDFQNQKGRWDFRWNSGRKNALCFAVWILALGALYLLTKIYAWDLSLWNIAWPTALICWGVFGIFPRFSFFPLGCMILGLYFLIRQINPTLIPLGGELLIPSLLILWGLSLLVSALRKSKHSSGSIYWNGKSISPGRKSKSKTEFKFQNTKFKWDGCFCEEKQRITMDLLSYGKADISFGDLELDLSGVKKLTPDCLIDANCSFGSMRILVPSQFKVECQRSNSFASIHCKATPDPDAVQTLYINADASFGEIVIETV